MSFIPKEYEDGTVEPVAGTGGLTVVTAGAGVGTETGRGSVENLKHGGSVRATVSDTDLTGLSVDATVGSETASSGQIVPVAGAETETDASSVSVTAEISATDLEDESVTATQTFDSMTGTVFDGKRTMKAGDTYPPITGTLTTNGGPVDLTEAESVSMWMRSTTLAINTDPCDIEDAVNGVVSYTPAPSETAVAGTYKLEWEVDWGVDGEARPLIQTFPNDSYETLEILEALDYGV